MTFHVEGMALTPVSKLFAGEVNDVYVCVDSVSPLKIYYTLIAVRDRDTAKNMLDVLNNAEGKEPPYITSFSSDSVLHFVFPYREERKLSNFFAGQLLTVNDWESYCLELVIWCMATSLPPPMLRLLLAQNNVNIERGGGAYLSYCADLKELSPSDSEADCVSICVGIMLDSYPLNSKVSKSAGVMFKKLKRYAYRGFNELYRDIKITALGNKRRGLFKGIIAAIMDGKPFFYRLLIVLAICAVIVAVIVLISQMIFGDIPLFKIFLHTFDNIGTRSLEN